MITEDLWLIWLFKDLKILRTYGIYKLKIIQFIYDCLNELWHQFNSDIGLPCRMSNVYGQL